MPNGRTILAGSTILEWFLQILEIVLADLDFGFFWNGSCRLSGLSGKNTSCGLSGLSDKSTSCGLSGLSGLSEHFLWTF
ncbi:hypothetical protein C1645_820415 [Glomus cerebriforme]|uniref:Uncharacterized protein n=1 Tax=Glomus cerebriforme TaxID=658196 RepID=A0A397T4B9_9GLOM|nr:hypothetical protein C1645_820415 [Glomus cerebriforme]